MEGLQKLIAGEAEQAPEELERNIDADERNRQALIDQMA